MSVIENFSSAQILMNRKLRTTIPGSNNDLILKIIDREKLNKTINKNKKNKSTTTKKE